MSTEYCKHGNSGFCELCAKERDDYCVVCGGHNGKHHSSCTKDTPVLMRDNRQMVAA
ncbi:MAG: hypothetical protein HGB08_04605 [Candidatus Moranbacteria bacterium]|nr:hypothetical protein [Candidatus Moranbacteria bacterium]